MSIYSERHCERTDLVIPAGEYLTPAINVAGFSSCKVKIPAAIDGTKLMLVAASTADAEDAEMSYDSAGALMAIAMTSPGWVTLPESWLWGAQFMFIGTVDNSNAAVNQTSDVTLRITLKS